MTEPDYEKYIADIFEEEILGKNYEKRGEIMTPNEYRKKHKRCATCEHWIPEFTNHFAEFEFGKCKVKNIAKTDCEGRFCRLYRAEEYRE